MVVDAFADIPVRCTARPSFPYHTPKLPATNLTAEETAWTATAVHAASAVDAVKALGNGITAEAAAAYALGFVAGARYVCARIYARARILYRPAETRCQWRGSPVQLIPFGAAAPLALL